MLLETPPIFSLVTTFKSFLSVSNMHSFIVTHVFLQCPTCFLTVFDICFLFTAWHAFFQCLTCFLSVPDKISLSAHSQHDIFHYSESLLTVPYKLSSVLDILTMAAWHDFFQFISSLLSVPYMISFIVSMHCYSALHAFFSDWNTFLQWLTWFLSVHNKLSFSALHDIFHCQTCISYSALHAFFSDWHAFLQWLTWFLSVHNKLSFSDLHYMISFIVRMHSYSALHTFPYLACIPSSPDMLSYSAGHLSYRAWIVFLTVPGMLFCSVRFCGSWTVFISRPSWFQSQACKWCNPSPQAHKTY